MAELREVPLEEINNVLAYTPNIPSNWYVPAQQAWTSFAWCLMQIRNNKTFRNDEQMNQCMDKFEAWIENYAIAFGEEHENEN